MKAYLQLFLNKSTGGISGGFLSLFIATLGGFFTANHYHHEITDQVQQTQSFFQEQQKQVQVAKDYQGHLINHQKLYQDFQRHHFAKPVSRSQGRAWLERQKKLLNLSVLKIIFLTDEVSPLGKGLVLTPVKLQVSALRDTDFFGLLEKLQQDLPGFFRLHSYTLQQKSPLNEAVLTQISTGKEISLFTGTITFDWIHEKPGK